MSAMDIAQAVDEATLRRSPRSRSPDKPTVFDTAISGAVPRSKSPIRTSPERTSRSRSPIRRSQGQPPIGSSRLNLFGVTFQKQNHAVVSQNSSKSTSAEAMDLAADKGVLGKDGLSSDVFNVTKATIWAPPIESFPQPQANKGGLGLFGQPSSPISH